ncbi:MAG: NUDIX domain-containing protein [Negativicutes bacterium]|nr:NUDIX domain-containing protein [Negativicutes bacterium]
MNYDSRQLTKSIASRLRAYGGREHVVGQTVSSAVVAALQRHDGCWQLLFEVRAAHLRRQPGEICFPGGRIEAGDADPAAAARREAAEELGIAAEAITIIGQLPRVISPVGATVWPYAGIIDDCPLSPPAGEVARLFRVPVAEIRNLTPVTGHMEIALRPSGDIPPDWLPPLYRPTDWSRRRLYPVLFYHCRQQIIWGITAQIVADLLAVLPEEI